MLNVIPIGNMLQMYQKTETLDENLNHRNLFTSYASKQQGNGFEHVELECLFIIWTHILRKNGIYIR